MNICARSLVVLLMVLLGTTVLVACGSDDEGGLIDGSGDGSGEGSGDAGVSDAGTDAGSDVGSDTDPGRDTGRDTDRDAGRDTGRDTSVDADSGSTDAGGPCASDEACGEGGICDDGECRAGCRTAADCGDNGYCDTLEFECRPLECREDADCADAEECIGGVCVDPLEVICEPATATCDGNALVWCSADGTQESRRSCGASTCVASDDGSAQCRDDVCEPDSVGCVDDTTAFLCSSDGFIDEQFPCRDGQICADGVCRPGSCEAGDAICEEGVRLVCAGGVEGFVESPCSEEADCQRAAAGCSCSDGDCVPRVCLPGTGRCVGAGVQRCADDGLSFLPVEPCDGGGTCEAGVCVGGTCEDGESRCSGDDLVECVDGAFESSSCTDVDAFCQDGACIPQVCEPDTTTCAPGGGRRICDARGAGFRDVSCGAGFTCSAGACVEAGECGVDPGYTATERCGDGADNDGDGDVDEDCACTFGTVQRCFSGAPGQRGVGTCSDGWQACENPLAPRWSACRDDVLPALTDTCDGRDDDCDGCIDRLDCAVDLTCPLDADIVRGETLAYDANDFAARTVTEVTWRVTNPDGAVVPLVATSLVQTLELLPAGTYSASVQMALDTGESETCAWNIDVRSPGLRAELSWSTFGSVDVDLHLAREPGPFCDNETDNDCYYVNCAGFGGGEALWGHEFTPAEACLEAGTAGCANPRLVQDNINGFNPEITVHDTPDDGDVYRLAAHMYSGSASTDATFDIWCGGELVAILGTEGMPATLVDSSGTCQGDIWRAADVTMDVNPITGAITCDVEPLLFEGDWWVETDNAAFDP